MPEVRQTARGAIVIDDRYAPIVISTFLGETDLELGHWYADTHKKVLLAHAAHGRRIVSISDASAAVKPTPEMRKFWADLSNNATEGMRGANLATFLVVNSPILRGAITAIGWLSPSLRDLESFSTIDEALREAMVRLMKAGLPLPKMSGGYQLPELAQKARASFGR